MPVKESTSDNENDDYDDDKEDDNNDSNFDETMKMIDFLHIFHICPIAVLYISTGREHGCLTPHKDLSPWKTIKQPI